MKYRLTGISNLLKRIPKQDRNGPTVLILCFHTVSLARVQDKIRPSYGALAAFITHFGLPPYFLQNLFKTGF